MHHKNKFRFGFRFFYFTTDILNVNPDVFTLLCSREYLENESMDEESGNISEEPRYKMCFYYIYCRYFLHQFRSLLDSLLLNRLTIIPHDLSEIEWFRERERERKEFYFLRKPLGVKNLQC